MSRRLSGAEHLQRVVFKSFLHRQIHTDYPAAVGGTGIELIDAQGRRYIDASGGPRCPVSGTAIPPCGPRCMRSSTSSPMRIPAFSPAKRRNRRAAGGLQPGAS